MSDKVYKENYELKERIKQMEEDFNQIGLILWCIGGPLNDNINGYSEKQLGTFRRIGLIVEGYGDTERG